MKKYEIEINGTTPIIWNRMKKEIEDLKKKAKKNELAEFEEHHWIDKAEFNGKDDVIIPPIWLKSMLINACKQTGLVPHFETKKTARYTRYMQSVIIPPKPYIKICKKDTLQQLGGYYPGQPGKLNSGKVWKIFPMKEKWNATFQLVDPFGRMTADELKELLEYGGFFIGIGDQRPMNYGRFDVVNIKEIE